MPKEAEEPKGRTEEQVMVWRLSDMLRAANFNVQHQLDLGKSVQPDLVAEREDFGRYRRYAIDVTVVSDSERLVDALNTLQRFARRKDTDFDEYWLVSNLSYPHPGGGRRRQLRYENVRAFSLKELERMLARLSPKQKPRAVKKSTAHTAIGKSIQANEKQITLAISGLILQIDEKLEKLGEHSCCRRHHQREND